MANLQLTKQHRKPKPSPEQRFWAKVKIGRPDECWKWQGARNSKGYGVTSRRRSLFFPTLLVHRNAWWLANSQPESLPVMILHSCDNPACCNPAHLRGGTHEDNMADMKKRGRRRCGATRDSSDFLRCSQCTIVLRCIDSRPLATYRYRQWHCPKCDGRVSTREILTSEWKALKAKEKAYEELLMLSGRKTNRQVARYGIE